MLEVKVPATSANLGAGFDCMGLALRLYNSFTAAPAAAPEIILRGAYTANIAQDRSNLLWRAACKLWERLGIPPIPLRISCENHVPPARGLGSSSTAVVGGLLLANHFAGEPLSRFELLEIATGMEGHPDNVAPALYGGVTLTVMTPASIVFRSLGHAPDLSLAVIVPDFTVETEKARAILPERVPRADAVFNASRVGLLTDAFLRREYELLGVGAEDRLHQARRAELVPGLGAMLEKAAAVGAYGAALSGSGPAVIAFCRSENGKEVAEAMADVLRDRGLNVGTFVSEVDTVGAVTRRI
ncbi:MAG: homoserine kinase [Gracilibacteraceae bacterium]|jgi:homoserine kinase|nr:homoserine kinase [Gracilibacteraceae bacterium]